MTNQPISVECTTTAISGVFKMIDTHGIPLEIILGILDDKKMVVAWDEFIDDARAHGWKDKTIRTKITGAVNEVFDHEYMQHFTERLELYMQG